MYRRRLAAGVIATAFVLGGVGLDVRVAAAQNLGGGDIIVNGVDLSGQWDFDMTILASRDPAMIGRTFSGSFTVTGGVPTYSGSGTFNGLPATISGSGAIDPNDPTTITLSDHIAATDSETHFTATLMSGDFGTGTFDGGTIDSSQTWSGVFKIAITRPPTQTPEERIESVFAVATQNLEDTRTTAITGMFAVVGRAGQEMIAVWDQADWRVLTRAFSRRARADIQSIREAAFHEIEAAVSVFRRDAAGIIDAAPSHLRPALRRLVGRRIGDLEKLAGQEKRGVDDGRRGSTGAVLLLNEVVDAGKDAEDRLTGVKPGAPPGLTPAEVSRRVRHVKAVVYQFGAIMSDPSLTVRATII